MIALEISPHWFCGKDLYIDFFSLFILLILTFFSLRTFKFSRNKKFKKLSMGFLALSISFLFKIFTNFTIYYKDLLEGTIGGELFNLVVWKPINLFEISNFFYHITGLTGLLIIYFVYSEEIKRSTKILIVYLVFLLCFLSFHNYYIFHLTYFIFFILLSNFYFDKYIENDNKNTYLLFISFLLISISQIFFIFIRFDSLLYVIGKTIQLIGFIAILVVILRIQGVIFGKKKK
ncbi:MAG: hypothetical protein ACOCRX_03380 [Candidatus Woesearchaeota archaeon]